MDTTGKVLDASLSNSATLRVTEMEERQRVAQHRKAARFIASQAKDVVDCAELLAMLGLDASEGKQ